MPALEASSLISIKNVLYPTDFSPASESALPFALELARIFGARITAVHVRTPDSLGLVPPLSFPSQDEDATAHLTGALEAKLAEVEHECLVGNGEVWDFIAEAIQERDIDLIVVGTQGRTGLEKFILGSVAELIFRQADCPVLTIGPQVAADNQLRWDMRRILWAIDFSPESLAAAPVTFSLARRRRSALTLLNVLEASAEDRVDPQRYIDSTVRVLQHLVPKAIAEECDVSYVVTEGIASIEIVKTASERSSDVIVLGVRPSAGRLGVATHIARPTAHKVVCKASCPVLTVRG